jgi:hypothetical protein
MAFSSFFMLENTVLSVERSVLTCSTRLLNSETTLTESAAVVVVDSTTGVAATGAATTGAGAAATGAGAAAGVDVEVEAEAALRPFLEATVAEAVEEDILYREPRIFFEEINAGMLIKLMKIIRVIFSLRG